MNSGLEILLNALPDLIERRGGGWLAISPQNSTLRIGVTGATQQDAIARFSLSIRAWIATLVEAEAREEKNSQKSKGN
jgi:hypothetical protein